jgi:hypothetical protein
MAGLAVAVFVTKVERALAWTCRTYFNIEAGQSVIAKLDAAFVFRALQAICYEVWC